MVRFLGLYSMRSLHNTKRIISDSPNQTRPLLGSRAGARRLKYQALPDFLLYLDYAIIKTQFWVARRINGLLVLLKTDWNLTWETDGSSLCIKWTAEGWVTFILLFSGNFCCKGQNVCSDMLPLLVSPMKELALPSQRHTTTFFVDLFFSGGWRRTLVPLSTRPATKRPCGGSTAVFLRTTNCSALSKASAYLASKINRYNGILS